MNKVWQNETIYLYKIIHSHAANIVANSMWADHCLLHLHTFQNDLKVILSYVMGSVNYVLLIVLIV